MNNTAAHSAGTLAPPTQRPAPPAPVSAAAAAPPGEPPLAEHRPDRRTGWRQHELTRIFIKPLASLRLTVVLFGVALFLIFVGTLAQTEQGIKYILDGYFRTWIAWIDIQAFIKFGQVFFGFPSTWRVDWAFPFPGGYVIGWVMFFNLLAAHTLRFKMTVRGLNMAVGLIGLLLGLALMVAASPLSPFAGASMATVFIGAFAVAAVTIIMLLSRQWRLRAGLVLAALLPLMILPAFDLFESAAWRASVVGALGMLVVVAASMLAFSGRAGMVILHVGVILMLLGEFMTAILATEGNMKLFEKHSSNFIENLSRMELAVVDPRNPETDDVLVIPQRYLTRAGEIDAEALPRPAEDGPFRAGPPFGIEVVRYMRNAILVPSPRADAPPNPATAGDGLRWVADEIPVYSGAGEDASKVDIPAMYANFNDRASGEPLGTYLLSLEHAVTDNPQQVTVGDVTYEVSLRFERTYLPFKLKLLDFNHDVYPGTDKAKDFSSTCQLIDPVRNEDRTVKISMNNPLRHAGLTIFQSSFNPRDKTETTLQVVDNPSWLLPYASCVLVAGGMLLHFGVRMSDSIRRVFK